jgi:hypothetical protein
LGNKKKTIAETMLSVLIFFDVVTAFLEQLQAVFGSFFILFEFLSLDCTLVILFIFLVVEAEVELAF